MRLLHIIKGDVKFQYKYGFYFLYAVLCALYIFLLLLIPSNFKEKVSVILIFSDPAAMGMFFMGAIILLEKSQRVLNSIAISPVKSQEYILAKIVSLGLISTIAGVIIAIAAGRDHLLMVTIGIFFSSAFFTMLGIIVGTMVTSLNQFFVVTIPFEIVCFSPALLILVGVDYSYLMFHPGCILIKMIMGESAGIYIIVLAVWFVLLFAYTNRRVKKMLGSVGGVKL